MSSLASKNRHLAEDWVLCKGCDALSYQPRWVRNLRVCAECGWHAERIRQSLDSGTVDILPFAPSDVDPLNFVGSLPYPQRIQAARKKPGSSTRRCVQGERSREGPCWWSSWTSTSSAAVWALRWAR